MEAVRKPGKPVALPARFEQASLAEAVGSLAYVCTGSSSQALKARETFERAAREGDFAFLFRRWWQEKTLGPLATEAVLQPWVTAVHQRIADRLAEWGLLGEEPLLLPCPHCGRVFTSRPPRFARTCGSCKPYTPSGQSNPEGSRKMLSAGFYPAGPWGPSRGQSVLCAHPHCLRLFLASSGQRRYCAEHQPDRKSVGRARIGSPAPKHTRVRFYPAGDTRPTQLSFRSAEGSERRLLIGPHGYQPQDEHELFQLAQVAHSGLLEARWTESVPSPSLARP